MVKKVVISFLLALIWLASSWTLLRPGFFHVHDYVHAARIAEMSRALGDGHFPVRWSQNFGYGYGMPLFEFYAPLPYYVGSLLYFFGFDLILILKLVFAGCSLLTLIGAYLAGKELTGRMGGIIAATLITLAPYRAVNLFIRGALSESWGMMALPWIIWGIILVIKQRKFGWLVLTLALTTLFLSHNLTTLMFVPLSLVLAGGYWLQGLISKRFTTGEGWLTAAKLAGSYVLAAGLSAFYVVPAFGEKDFTKVESIVGGYFDYRLHFLYIRQFIRPGWGFGGSNWGPDDGISFYLGWSFWLAVGLVGVVVGWWFFQSLKKRPGFKNSLMPTRLFEGGLLLSLAGIAFFMSIGKAQFIWDSLPFLAFIQFPWRWLSSAIVLAGLGLAYSVYFIPRRSLQLLVVFVILVTSLATAGRLFRPEKYLETADSLYYSDGARIQTHMSGVLQDYVPHQMADRLDIDPQPPIPLVMNATGEVEVISERVHQKLLRTSSTQPQTVELGVADFPGWYAELDGQPLTIKQTTRGNIQLDLPAGDHVVGLGFGSTPLRLVSDGVSALSWLLVLFISLSPPIGREKMK